MLDLEVLHGGRSRVSVLEKSILTTTVDCLSHVGQVRLTALQTGRRPTLSVRVINRPCVARSIGDSLIVLCIVAFDMAKDLATLVFPVAAAELSRERDAKKIRCHA